jgi:hypothetical protein
MVGMRRVSGRRLRLVLGILAPVAASLLFPSPAWSRLWKPSKAALVQDYAQIIDNRGDGEVVIVWWLVPEMFENAPEVRDLVDKHVVLGLVHATTSPDGTMSFAPIDGAEVKNVDGTRLAPETGDQIPPTLTGVLSAIEATLRQALGPMGQGIHWFVFDGAGVNSCTKGGISVPFAGQDYTFDTPIPGCP